MKIDKEKKEVIFEGFSEMKDFLKIIFSGVLNTEDNIVRWIQQERDRKRIIENYPDMPSIKALNEFSLPFNYGEFFYKTSEDDFPTIVVIYKDEKFLEIIKQ